MSTNFGLSTFLSWTVDLNCWNVLKEFHALALLANFLLAQKKGPATDVGRHNNLSLCLSHTRALAHGDVFVYTCRCINMCISLLVLVLVRGLDDNQFSFVYMVGQKHLCSTWSNSTFLFGRARLLWLELWRNSYWHQCLCG